MSTSDNDDLRRFASPHGALARRILRVKRNDAAVTSLRLTNVDYSDEAWTRLGDIVGRSEHLEELNISHGDPEVMGLCAGLRNNRCLRRLDFLGVDLRDVKKMRSLAPFLKDNPRLRDVTLAACNIGPASMNILSAAISGCSLERVNLCCNYLGDVDFDALVEALSRNKNLTHLRLSGCGIGRRECAALASLLRNRTSNLKELRLNVNSIDDECTVLLAESLSNNTKLKELALNGNLDLNGKNGITSSGLSAILKLVCNTSSFDTVMGSNHALCRLGMEHADLAKMVGRNLSVDDVNLLCASLKANGRDDETTVLRQKMLWSHARGDLNLGESSVHTGAMPRLLAWFAGSFHDTNEDLIQYHGPQLPKERMNAIRLDSIYRIVSSMPELGNTREHGQC